MKKSILLFLAILLVATLVIAACGGVVPCKVTPVYTHDLAPFTLANQPETGIFAISTIEGTMHFNEISEFGGISEQRVGSSVLIFYDLAADQTPFVVYNTGFTDENVSCELLPEQVPAGVTYGINSFNFDHWLELHVPVGSFIQLGTSIDIK